MNKLSLDVPDKLMPFLQSRKMYQVLYGGRSSAKTYTILLKLLMRALEKPRQTILCTREYQASIAKSTYTELTQLIYAKKLDNLFRIKHDEIICHNGTKFIFQGIARNVQGIKSIPNIDVCFVEEAETIGGELWDVLNPTLRKEGCELIIAFNPRESTSYTYQHWVLGKIKEENILRIEINYPDNPFNSRIILEKIQELKENNYALYEHIYLGKVMDMSEDVIFKGRFKILDLGFEEHEGFYYRNKAAIPRNEKVYFLYGMDFGFSTDPVAMVEVCFPDDDTVYIHREHYEHQLLPTQYLNTIEHNFGARVRLYGQWRGDESRPDTIAQLAYDGLKIEAAPKGKGSVEAGIQYLLGKNIIVHPRCKNFIFECFNYKYKKDKNTGIITTDIVDAHNHGWDALRYALCEQIAANGRKPMKVNPAVWQQLGIY
jgi:phage terminase large subunit